MIAVLGGLGAAACWALSTLCLSRASRLLAPSVVLAWIMLVGLVVNAPLAAARGMPAGVGASSWVWLAVGGAGNVTGLLIAFRALRISSVSLVAPLTSTEGAIAAVIAILAGERLSIAEGAALAVVVIGAGAAAIPPDPAGTTARRHHLRAALLAVVAASCYGVSLYATGRASAALPGVWVALSSRAVGVAVVAIPLIARRRLPRPGGATRFVVTSGLVEVGGFLAYAWAARHGIAVASVLASQFAAIAVAGAWLLFGERLGRLQLVGLACLLVGVGAVSLLRA